ncbi:MAG: hypothetical protein HY080_06885 [Gammaproteobacteria bacterium]|nr:hypothetical protein [Gammaproteobacteria bacterium]
MAIAPSPMDDCYHHCMHHGMSTDQMKGMKGMQHDTSGGGCNDDRLACGHCAHCGPIPFLSGPIEFSFVSSSQTHVAVSPTDPPGFIPPLHEHPPRG